MLFASHLLAVVTAEAVKRRLRCGARRSYVVRCFKHAENNVHVCTACRPEQTANKPGLSFSFRFFLVVKYGMYCVIFFGLWVHALFSSLPFRY